MSKIEMHNIRFGFACNSSSTHSIIFLRKNAAEDGDVATQEFGWANWTAATPESKLAYLGQTLRNELQRDMPDEAACLMVREWLGVAVDPDGYVDHQSQITLPRSWNGKSANREFVDDFATFLKGDDVAILGGNNNDDEHHPLGSKDVRPPIAVESSDVTVARKDSRGYWTVFNRSTGTKVRFSFSAIDDTTPPRKADAPELVDVKITDLCPFGCSYCYQGSTPKGEHADPSYLRRLIWSLGDMRVFEIAIGGGEPTLCPQFVDLLGQCRAAGVVPNFTTRNLHWFRDPSNLSLYAATCGAVAFSVDSAPQVVSAAALKIPRLTIQYVVGAGTENELRSIIREARSSDLPLTLLGYKTTGRGGVLKPNRVSLVRLLVDMASRNELPRRLGIDTAIADQYGEELKAAGVSSRLFTVKEGEFSCYVDAVAQKIGPSSYAPDRMVAMQDASPSAITAAFAAF